MGWVIQFALADLSHEPGSEFPGGRSWPGDFWELELAQNSLGIDRKNRCVPRWVPVTYESSNGANGMRSANRLLNLDPGPRALSKESFSYPLLIPK
jgi:hypothetical protein